MSKLAIVNNATRAFHKLGFAFKKHSPEILVVAGVVGTVASAVMACKATTKLDEVLEEHKHKIDTLHEAMEDPENLPEEVTVQDCKKDLTIHYAHAVIDVAKLYAPAVGVGVLSIGAILSGHNVLRKRNMALAAAYATVDKSFKEYRGRVIERFGKELDKELKYNIKTQEIEEIVVNEDGSETKVKKTVDTIDIVDDLAGISEYAKFFDQSCRGWEKNAELNMMTLRQVQNWANDKLRRQGYLFLNDVYEALGIDKTTAGQIVGWLYDEEVPNGDNFIDFGIYNVHREANRKFVNGFEPVILLDFNVDGDIVNKFAQYGRLR